MKKTVVFTMLLTLFALPALAGMESDNYRLTSTVVSGGGNSSESATFKLQSTLGQPTPLLDQAAPPYSTTYDLYPGFWYTMETGPVCVDLAAFAAAFGSLDGDADYSLSCDYEGDGDVDGSDLSEFIAGL